MTVDINRIKNKIRALLARNVENGVSVAEAETCLEKAQELLDEFNIDIKELLEDTDPNTQKVIREEIYENGNISPELWELFCQTAWLFNCEAIKSRKWQKGCRYRRVHISIIGNPINVEKVKYFIQLFEDILRESLKIEKITGLRNINSFRRGFYLTLCRKAGELRHSKEAREEKLKLEAQTGTSLIVLDKRNVDNFIKAEIPDLKTKSNNMNNYGKATDYNSYKRGISIGNTVGFNDAVESKGRYIGCQG